MISLPLAAGFGDQHGRIAGFGLRADLPDFLARILVERDNVAPLAADERDQFLAVDERVRRVAPQRGFALYVCLKSICHTILPESASKQDRLPIAPRV